MKNISQNFNFIESALELLLIQYKEESSFIKGRLLFSSFLEPFKNLEIDILEVSKMFDLDQASLYQLDQIGSIVGIKRGGRLDPEYRVRIKAQIAINNSKGKIDDILNILHLITGATAPRVFELYHPRSVFLFVNSNLSSTIEEEDLLFAYDGAVGSGYDEAPYAEETSYPARSNLKSLIDSTLQAGKRLEKILYSTADEVFTYDSDGFGYDEGSYVDEI